MNMGLSFMGVKTWVIVEKMKILQGNIQASSRNLTIYLFSRLIQQSAQQLDRRFSSLRRVFPVC
jgi:hypothetical protein